MKKVLSLILTLMMLAGFAGAFAEGAAVEDTGIRKDTLVVAIQAEPATMDVYAASHDTTSISSETIFESLLKYEDGEYKPWLATSYEIVDETTIVFHLRDDVYFHDGNRMTAEDVIFSLCCGAQSNFTSTLFGAIDPENTKALDDYTVELKLLYAYAPIMDAIACYRGAIISKAAFEAMGADEFGRAPVGTGPMKFSQWVAGDRIELVGFDEYWGEKPAFDNMTIRFILEDSSRAIELETGGVDIAFQVATTDWSRLEDNPETRMITGYAVRSNIANFDFVATSIPDFAAIVFTE